MTKEEDIQAIRRQIDTVDDEINALLALRAECAIDMKRAKGEAPIYRPSREALIIKRMQSENKSKLPAESVAAIFTEIVASCRNLEQRLNVVYLGPEGSYSHEAAQKMFGTSSDFIPQLSLREVIRKVEADPTAVAFLPIENSSEGAVIETHRLLLSTPLQITGEYTLPIKHCLLSMAQDLAAIKVVHAHPQALGQCREWLQRNLPHAELINESSNSQAAMVALKKPATAAIASQQAAMIVGIPVLKTGINDFSGNQTRFVALSTYETQPTGDDKTSIICTVRDKVGALHELLGIFEKHKLSLVRLESQPHPDHQYAFYIDFDGHSSTPAIAQALEELTEASRSCKILGSYPKGHSNNGSI